MTSRAEKERKKERKKIEKKVERKERRRKQGFIVQVQKDDLDGVNHPYTHYAKIFKKGLLKETM